MPETTTTTTRNVEVVPLQPTYVTPGWQDQVYTGVKDGSWAIILVAFLAYVTFRGSVSKYMNKHMMMLDTMKDSLSKNADSLERIAKTDEDQSESLRIQGAILLKQGDAIVSQQNTILNIDQRQKESVSQALDLLGATAINVSTMATENRDISAKITELRELAEQHQSELVSRLQMIEDLYHASEEATGNKGTLKNFWRR